MSIFDYATFREGYLSLADLLSRHGRERMDRGALGLSAAVGDYMPEYLEEVEGRVNEFKDPKSWDLTNWPEIPSGELSEEERAKLENTIKEHLGDFFDMVMPIYAMRKKAIDFMTDQAAKHAERVRVRHWGKKLEDIDPNMYGSRSGAFATNNEFSGVASGARPKRTYAYTRKPGPKGTSDADHPSSILGGVKNDFEVTDVYNANADPMNLRAEAKARAEAKGKAHKYPYTPSEQMVIGEFENLVREKGFTGTWYPEQGQVFIFEEMDLIDMPARLKLAKKLFPDVDPVDLVARTRNRGGTSIQAPRAEYPEEGFAVGMYPKDEVIKKGKIDTTDVDKYLYDKRVRLGNEDNYFGTWQDGPETYLDVSKVFPDERAATWAGEMHGQKAIYDIKNKNEITVPSFDEWLKSQEVAERLAEAHKVGKAYMKQHPNEAWWDTFGTEIEDVYGDALVPYFSGYASVTSNNEPLRRNAGKATEYLRRQIKGEPIMQPGWRTSGDEVTLANKGKMIGMESGRKQGLEAVRRGDFKDIQKRKRNQMYRAMVGDDYAGPMDTWYAKGMEKPSEHIYSGPKKNAIHEKRYRAIEDRVREGAAQAGEPFRQYSSEVWTGLREMAKRDGMLFGQKIPNKALEDSKGLADHFSELLTEKAKKLGITRDELKKRLRSGDANLLSILLGVPVAGILATSEQGFQSD